MKKHRILITGLAITYTLFFSSCNLIIKTKEAIDRQTVATVGKVKITRGEIDSSYEWAEAQLYAMYMGANLDPNTDIQTYFQYKSQALSGMIDAEAVIVEAEKQKITVDQTKLQAAVDKNMSDFKANFTTTNTTDSTDTTNSTTTNTTGTFDQASYDNYFKSMGITEKTYIDYQTKTERVNLIWDELLKNVPQPTDDEIKSDFDTNKATYEGDYNKLDTDHILIAINDPNDTTKAIRTDAEALARAKEVKAKLDAGADFAAMVTEYSDDTGTKANGGKVGDVTFGTLDAGYVAGAKVLNPGQISDPVKSQYGYHIIKLNSITLDGDDYEKMKPIISDKIYQDRKTNEKTALLQSYKTDLPVVTTKYQNNLINTK
ncbi:MAG: peptidylprolyl isomerase [Oscillospiraceae bacterium]|nr:peptidylprolyl isomerase [Oscillospiraceae bacterium]